MEAVSPHQPEPMFLTREEVATLTGRKTKSKQIEALKTMGIPFHVNALQEPVVTRAAVLGRREAKAASGWAPRVAQA